MSLRCQIAQEFVLLFEFLARKYRSAARALRDATLQAARERYRMIIGGAYGLG